MALAKKILTIPLGSPLDESADPKLVDAAHAVAGAENAIFNKDGRAEKAPGYAYEAAGVNNTGDASDVLTLMHSAQSDGTNLIVGGSAANGGLSRAEGYHIAARRVSATSYDPIGHWYPIHQTKRTACANRSGAKDPDCCYTAAAGAMPAAIWSAWIEGGAVKLCTVRADNGAVLTTPTDWTITGAPSSVVRVRLLQVGAYVHLYAGGLDKVCLGVALIANGSGGGGISMSSVGTLVDKAWARCDDTLTNADTWIEATTAGWLGNYINVQFLSAGSLSITVTASSPYGYDVLIKFNNGVTTVAQVEAAIAALSGADDVIGVRVAGTGTNVLVAVDDEGTIPLANSWALWDAIKVSAGTPAADISILAYAKDMSGTYQATQLGLASYTAAGAAGAYGPTTVAVYPGYSLAIAKCRVTTGGTEALAVVYEAAGGANAGDLCLVERAIDSTFSSVLAEAAFASPPSGESLTNLTICQERITETQESSACSGLAVWAEFAENVGTDAPPWRHEVRPYVVNATTGAVKRNVLGPWYNHRLMSRALEYDRRSHVWLVHESTTWPVCSLVSFGKIISTVRPLETEANWLRATACEPQVNNGYGNGLGSIVAAGSTPETYYWPAITADAQDVLTVTCSAYTYAAEALQAAKLGAAHLTGGGQLMVRTPTKMSPHGFAHPPEIESLSAVYNAGTYSNALQGGGTYRYLAIYEYLDAAGELHRSAPSVSASVDVPSVGYSNGQTLVITSSNNVLIVSVRCGYWNTSTGAFTNIAGPTDITITIPAKTYASFDEMAEAIQEAGNSAISASISGYDTSGTFYCWKGIPPDVPDIDPGDPSRIHFAFHHALISAGCYYMEEIRAGSASCTIKAAIGLGTSDILCGLEKAETEIDFTDRNVAQLSTSSGLYSLDEPESTTAGAATIKVRPLAPGEYYRNVDSVKIAIYRTEADGTTFHRVAELANAYADYEVSATDTMSDALALAEPLAYTTGEPGDVLEHTTPVGRTLATHRDRVWLVDDENPRTVFASLPKADGYAVEFSEFSKVALPDPVTALASLGDVAIAWTASGCYAISGQGPSAAGLGEFAAARLLAAAGADGYASVCAAGDSVLWFSTERGLWSMDRGYQPQEIGRPILDSLSGSASVVSMVDRPDERRIEIYLSDGTAVWYDYRFRRWTTQTGIVDLQAACYHGGTTWHVAGSTGSNRVCYQTTVYTRNGTAFSLKVTTHWIKVNALTGMERVWWERILGDWRDSHSIRVRRWVDYITSAVDSDRTVAITTDPGPYLLRHCPRTQSCSACKLEISDVASGSGQAGFRLSALELEVGVKRGYMTRGKVR